MYITSQLVRLFAVTLLGFVLTGCASAPQLAKELGAKLAETNQRIRAGEDDRTAHIISTSSGAASLRAWSLQQYPRTVEALMKACESGRPVEVLVHARSNDEAPARLRQCARVFYSNDPQLGQGDNVLVTSDGSLYSQGFAAAPNRKVLEQEYLYRQALKQQSWRAR